MGFRLLQVGEARNTGDLRADEAGLWEKRRDIVLGHVPVLEHEAGRFARREA